MADNRKVVLTHEDLLELGKLVDTTEQLLRLVHYMSDRGVTITLEGTFDSLSGWHGNNVYIEGCRIGNGYVKTGRLLMRHIETFPMTEKIFSSDEWKEYVRLRDKYKQYEEYER